jgi:hydrogenase maturation factor
MITTNVTKVVLFKGKNFLSLCFTLKDIEWNGIIKIDNQGKEMQNAYKSKFVNIIRLIVYIPCIDD